MTDNTRDGYPESDSYFYSWITQLCISHHLKTDIFLINTKLKLIFLKFITRNVISLHNSLLEKNSLYTTL